MGAFETPTETRPRLHIFTADKGDYYEIADGLPQNPHQASPGQRRSVRRCAIPIHSIGDPAWPG
jgi:hypothetical protein